MLLKAMQDNEKRMNATDSDKLFASKSKLNRIRKNIDRFNISEKPVKIVKKLIEEKFLPS
jgi:hypothetical protein